MKAKFGFAKISHMQANLWSKSLADSAMAHGFFTNKFLDPSPSSTRREDYEALSIMGKNLEWGFSQRGFIPVKIVFKFKGSRQHAEREFCLWLVKQRLKE